MRNAWTREVEGGTSPRGIEEHNKDVPRDKAAFESC